MKRMFLCIFWSVLLVSVGVMASQAATNDQYCVNPVYSINPVNPNVMIVQDMSGSMLFSAYMPDTADGGRTTGGAYNTTRSYFGLFDTGLCYQYVSANGQFESVASCDCSNKVGSSACISGNILNWATASRIDVAKKALTGGKLYSSTTNILVSEGVNGTDYGLQSSYSQVLLGDDSACIFSINGSRQLTIRDGSVCTCRMVDIPSTCRTVQCNPHRHGNRTYWDTCNVCDQEEVCDGAGCATTCNLGDSVISNANIRVKADDVNDIGGLVQSFADRVNFEYMIYKSDHDNNYGKMISGKGVTEPALVTAINSERPYYGTPTGPAMKAAYTWYTQGTNYDSSTYVKNTGFIDKGNASSDKDPYFDGIGGNAVSVPCRKSYILLLSDGEWNVGSDPAPVAYKMHTEDLRSDVSSSQTVTTYAIYLFGSQGAGGANAMKTVALFGGFDYSTSDLWPYTFTSMPSSSLSVTWPRTNCNPSGTWNAGSNQCPEWDKSMSPHSGLPYNYFEASQGDELVAAVTAALNDMVRKASSGTAASVLGSSEGSGANLIQSFYYPKRTYANGDITWMGAMQNLWFYIDPTLGSSTMREDTTNKGTLDYTGDCIIEYEFDTSTYKTMVHKYEPASDGSKGTEGGGSCSPSPVEIDAVNPLWEAGDMLWLRDSSTRNIFTNVNATKTPFTTSYADPLYNYMDPPGTSVSDKIAGATNIINYIRGNHIDGFRNRSVQMTYGGTEQTHVWKLGDIISSTPRMKSSVPVNSYHLGSPDGYADSTYREYINSTGYKRRGMVYVGANDGMLHAFDLGNISYDGLDAGQIAKINTVDPNSADAIVPGTEQWAFVPKNVLPYLKYLTDPQYCHMYFVDAPVTLVDASVVVSTESPECDGKANCKRSDSWRTILIGGMGSGGACRDVSQTCAGGGTECTQTPISGVGFSSYFAIDVTDPTSPSLLWEFSSDQLGYSTTGPAIVRIGDPAETGHWYVVFANGPTGTVETSYNQLKAQSDQYLKMFAFDLFTGPGASNVNVKTITTTIANAFGGSLSNATLDVDKGKQETGSPYNDDVFYLGYTNKDTALGTWTKGGVIRVMTNNNTDPSYWSWSKVIDNIGPVTGSVSKLQDRNNSNLWLYFGTGRYWYRTNTIDSASDQQALYGVKEPCYSYDNQMKGGCTALLTRSDLSDKSGNVAASTTAVSTPGWYINLEVPASTYKAERMVSGPVALNNGVVIFTTIEPSADICAMGGTTFVWVTWYNNGTAPPASALTGQVMVQVSSGRIALKGLGGISTDTGHTAPDGGRTISLGEGGTAGGSGGSVIVGPRPLQKILHIRER